MRGTAADLQLPGRPLLMWWGKVVPLARGAQREAAHGAPVPLASRTMGLAAIEAPEPDLGHRMARRGPLGSWFLGPHIRGIGAGRVPAAAATLLRLHP